MARRIELDIDKLKAARLDGASCDMLADMFSVSRNCIRNRLIEVGMPTNGKPPSGSKHGNWKGGKFKDTQGYIRMLAPNHPRAVRYSGSKYVGEHILVWEDAHGCPLPDNWLVHHLNGIKDDNRPENLKGLPKKCHDTHALLHAVQERVRELEKFKRF